ncbi:FtsK/SpoIIIE family DNA translocase [Halanaerobacter jeridensis]|uniref:S-DNA-T family DNA segregation ATPase FtsK/SpoIIIE n=1 Tax=Halanaerobacter jeridensis TaxID=706427 RepID=A0A938XU11_9FIRM|nr:DNA translocase FtsK [Halanaerobacter jeridensis]MBM7557894.1 S-DNA-T family DNA segregation ATPase FtsK/SpoIIIE [Halanaerobacter jeridensis]
MKETLKNIWEKRKFEFGGLLLITISVLDIINKFSQSTTGVLGEAFGEFLRLLVGNGRITITILLFIWGVGMIYRSEVKFIVNSRGIGLGIILLMIFAFLHVDSHPTKEFVVGLRGEGGGVIGATILYVLRKVVATTGSYIVLGTGIIIGILLLLDVALATILEDMKNLIVSLVTGSYQNIKGIIVKIIEAVKNVGTKFAESTAKVKKKFKSKKTDKSEVEKEKSKNVSSQSKMKSQVAVSKESKEKSKEESKEKRPKGKTKTESNVDTNDSEVSFNQQGNQIKKERKSNSQIQIQLDNEDGYHLPPLELLQPGGDSEASYRDKREALTKTLDNFGIDAQVTEVNFGPTITRYEIEPAPGVKVSKIVNLGDDIALSLAASDVRIEAPIPGKAAVGIEVPNDTRKLVTLREILESDKFQNADSKLTMALGKDIDGQAAIADLAEMPHMLVAGATGSGKSVFINGVINSMLYKAKPEEVKFLLVDPKMVELTIYKGLPHLVAPVVTDPKKAATALRWVVEEMENRYELFAGSNARGLDSYNQQLKSEGKDPLPYIVVVIDELADLMMVAANEVEDAICRLAQKARAAGIHLILATQRPSVDVVTGLIKANIPTRLSFSLSSQADSRTILDEGGAEKLLGQGDMLFSPVDANQPLRLQGAFVSDSELKDVVQFIKQQDDPNFDEKIAGIKDDDVEINLNDEKDDLYKEAVKIVAKERASISLLQRKLRIGYNRAARMIDTMEEENIVGPHRGSKAREVLINEDDLEEILN